MKTHVFTATASRSGSRPLPNIAVEVTTSVGTVPITPTTTDLDTLLHEADQAMYAAKSRRT